MTPALFEATIQAALEALDGVEVIRRGNTLRLTDRDGRANVSALLVSSACTSERYNMPDTLKAQHTAYLTAGCVCCSDMGRVLCSISDDTCGWHDTVCRLLDDEREAAIDRGLAVGDGDRAPGGPLARDPARL